jgi:hypothetical protein
VVSISAMNIDTSDPKSFAFFPFLKTTAPVHLGNFKFQSSDDPVGLSDVQVDQIHRIHAMLFWRDDLRLKSSAFAVVPFIDPDRPDQTTLNDLAAVQSVVAYMYGAPHEVFGDSFLSAEHAALLIFTAGSVPRGLALPDHHVESVTPTVSREPTTSPHVAGFHGIFNFHDQFWTTEGSRIHGSLPHMTLNISQDLAQDMTRMPDGLGRLISRPPSTASERILTSIRWFNESNTAMNDEAAALVDLAIAFETLLGIPAVESKTDRFVDAIALLLGRVPRVDVWARQFYNARSNVAHEGRARQIRFVASDSSKPAKDAQLYQSLLAVGRQVFRLCLRTVSVGTFLAEQDGLEEKFVTNRERFERVCRILDDKTGDAAERLARAAPTIQAIHDYKFVAETGLALDAVIGAARLAAQAALDTESELPVALADGLRAFLAAPKSSDDYERLEALAAVDGVVRNPTLVPERKDPWRPAVQLLEDSAMICMWHFFRLQRQRSRTATDPSSSPPTP